jgi:hypothetical protein
MGLIKETNAQYYAGQQVFTGSTSTGPYTWTGDTDLTLSPIPNFKVLKNEVELTITTDYTVSNNSITLVSAPLASDVISINLLTEFIWNNYGSYEYISIDDVVNNFLMSYVGYDKIIPRVKRTDVLFHAKRGLQEFSYDTLPSIKKIEITIPPSLSFPIPQDYVNYVRLGWTDSNGVFHPLYPVNTLTQYPTEVPIQDNTGLPTQDNNGENLESYDSVTVSNWKSSDTNNLTGEWEELYDDANIYNWSWRKGFLGRRYGMDPVISQSNGWYAIDRRENKFSFSSDIANKTVIIEYISDGLAYDGDVKIPKMAEEALYMHIMHAIVSTRAGVPEYVVSRYKRERSVALRNAKLRLSNLKLGEMIQNMRGKSKWLKH